MIHASRRIASCVTQQAASFGSCQQSTAFCLQSQRQWSTLRAQQSAFRLPTSLAPRNRPFTASKKGAREAEASNPASKEFQGKNFVKRGTAQRKVNDRPWQREDTGAHPEPTPAHAAPTGDSKGMHLTDYGLLPSLLMIAQRPYWNRY